MMPSDPLLHDLPARRGERLPPDFGGLFGGHDVSINGKTTAPPLRATRPPGPDYVVPDFGGLWEPSLTFLPNGWGVAITEVTPALAAAMLATNRADNRNRRQTAYTRYADDIRCGRWRLTHQGIAFDRQGRLCDGQHRLFACVQAEKPFRSLVFFGAGGNEEMAVHDTGAGRTAQDASQYVLGERVGHQAISLVRNFIQGVARTRPTFTHSYLLSQVDRYYAAVLFQADAFPSQGKQPVAPVRAALCRAYYHHDRDDLIRFAGVLTERLDPSESRDATAKMLRHYLQLAGTRRGIDRQREQYCKAQRAIASYLSAEPLSKLYASEDDLFPLPSDDQLRDRNAAEEAALAAKRPDLSNTAHAE